MSQRGDCCGCGPGECAQLRVTAVKRWSGWTPFNQRPSEDVVTTLYRTITVVETVTVAREDHAALIYAREATPEEVENNFPVGTYECPYPGGSLTLYADGNGAPVNYMYWTGSVSRTTVARQLAGTFGVNSRLGAQPGWGITAWPWANAEGNREPAFLPQYRLATGDYCLDGPESEATQTQADYCECGDDLVEQTTAWGVSPTAGEPGYNGGVGCPPAPEGYTCAAGANGANGTKWIFDSLPPGMAEVSNVVSEGGLKRTVGYESTELQGPHDTMTVEVTLSEPWTLAEAEASAQALLNRVDLTAGRQYLQCTGEPLTLGCGEGEAADVVVTEDAVCSGATVLQRFIVMPAADYFDPVPGLELLAQRHWCMYESGGKSYGLVTLTKSAVTFASPTEVCRVPFGHPDDSQTVVEGAAEACADLDGPQFETPLTPGLMDGSTPLWGKRVVST